MINFCEHSIVTFSLKFVFRGHCITLKSYNQWRKGVFFSGHGDSRSKSCPQVHFFFFFFAVFCKFEIKILVSRNYQELDTFGYINTILEVQNNNCILSYVRFQD